MEGTAARMTERDHAPEDAEVGAWIGAEAHGYWKHVVQRIEEAYPAVFTPEWLFGGRKHGWSLRYKKGRSFCTLIPEKNRFALLIVFGTEERKKVEAARNDLARDVLRAYDGATTYHDGKWLLLAIDSAAVVDDVMRLLAIKRRPKGAAVPRPG
jgi:hypothetical protein